MTRGIAAFDGLDAKGRTHLWEQLVVGQDKNNLARIFASISKAGNQSAREGESHGTEFVHALAVAGTAEQKLGFVSALKQGAITGAKNPQTNLDARAIAGVIAKTSDPKLISAYVGVLGRAGVDSVTKASVLRRDVPEWASSANIDPPVDTRLYEALAKAISLSDNPRYKAAFVAASGPVVDALNTNVTGPNHKRKELAAVSHAISTVIGTDTTNIVETTMLQNPKTGGSDGIAALKSYVRALFDSGKGAVDIGAITLQLQRGNDLKQEPLAYLSVRERRSGQSPTFARAWVMGGWLGLIGSAVQGRANKRDTNAAFSSLAFVSGIDTFKEAVGARFPAFKVAGGIVAPLLKGSVNSSLLEWRNQATKSDINFVQSLVKTTLPRYPSGVEATADWTQTMQTQQALRLGGN